MNRRTLMMGTAFAAVCAAARALPQDTNSHEQEVCLAQRARAQKVLAAKYDIRKFHEAMLLPGAVPRELLEHIYV